LVVLHGDTRHRYAITPALLRFFSWYILIITPNSGDRDNSSNPAA
jgi:hypothetical protein